MENIFISDIHLGVKDCKAEFLDSFLKKNKPKNLYLVGDIVDFWRLKNKSFWPQSHVNLVRRILSLARKETKVHWIIGNHDYHLVSYLDKNLYFEFGNISIERVVTHKNWLVLHGDQFDPFRNIAFIGDKLYGFLSMVTKRSGGIRNRVKKFAQDRIKFQEKAIKVAKSGRYDGVICGHSHNPKIEENYINCGDMIENFSLVIDEGDEHSFLPKLIYLDRRI